MTQESSGSAIGPDLRNALIAMVRKRVHESEVEDIVQAALTEAVVSPSAPTESDALRRWIFGVAKNKVADFHRRRGRVKLSGKQDPPEIAGDPAPHQEADLLRWAEKNLPQGEDAQKTLDWMLREGDGEKLESIAESERVPAPRVRQRVSRLRRHLRTHWQREVALLAALGVIVTAVLLWLRSPEPEPIANDPRAIPLDPRAAELRDEGLALCARGAFERCVDKLDEAKKLDPAGDTRPEVKRAREEADKALAPVREPPPPAPTTSADTPRQAPPIRSAPPTKNIAPTRTTKPIPTAPPAPPVMPKKMQQQKVDPASKPSAPSKSNFGGSSL